MVTERNIISDVVSRLRLKEFVKKETERAGFGGMDIQRTPMGTLITLRAERPGMVIGSRGKTIKSLTSAMEKKFNFENPQIEVEEIKNPNLNANIMAHKLSVALERGWHFRRAGHSTVRKIVESGARGCQVVLAGKITGQRHRTEKFRDGHIKYCGETVNEVMDIGYAVAKKKLGTIGIKVMIMKPKAKLPDEVDFVSEEEAMKIVPEAEVEELKIDTSIQEEDEEEYDKDVEDEALEELKKTEESKKSGKKKSKPGKSDDEKKKSKPGKSDDEKKKSEPGKASDSKVTGKPKKEVKESKESGYKKTSKDKNKKQPAARDKFELDENCIFCGSVEELRETHIKAPSKGGKTTITACATCSSSKGDKPLMEWMRWLKENREEHWEKLTEFNKGKRSKLAKKVHRVRDEADTKPQKKVKKTDAKEEESLDENCIFCGSAENLRRAHIKAPSKGGKTTITACATCSSSKGDKPLMEWMRWLKENREEHWEKLTEFNKGKRKPIPKKVHKIRDENSK